MRTLTLKISLLREPGVIREIEVPEKISLYELAEAIVGAYDFDFDHCFGFFDNVSEGGYLDAGKKYELFTDLIEEGIDIEPTGAASVKRTKVCGVWRNPGDKMLFLFDYGDNWQFVVELADFGKRTAKRKYPRLLRKVGEAPEQYPELDKGI